MNVEGPASPLVKVEDSASVLAGVKGSALAEGMKVEACAMGKVKVEGRASASTAPPSGAAGGGPPAPPWVPPEPWLTPLHRALSNHRWEEALQLAQDYPAWVQVPSPPNHTFRGWLPLHQVANEEPKFDGRSALYEVLLRHTGRQINARTSRGLAPLHMAASGQPALMTMMLSTHRPEGLL